MAILYEALLCAASSQSYAASSHDPSGAGQFFLSLWRSFASLFLPPIVTAIVVKHMLAALDSGPSIPAYVRRKVQDARRAYVKHRDRRVEEAMRHELDRITHRIPAFRWSREEDGEGALSAAEAGAAREKSRLQHQARALGGHAQLAWEEKGADTHHREHDSLHRQLHRHTQEAHAEPLPQTDGERILMRVKHQLNRQRKRDSPWEDAWQGVDEDIIDADYQVEVIDDQRLGLLENHVASLLVSVKALQASMDAGRRQQMNLLLEYLHEHASGFDTGLSQDTRLEKTAGNYTSHRSHTSSTSKPVTGACVCVNLI